MAPDERERLLAEAAASAQAVFGSADHATEGDGRDTSFAALHGLYWLATLPGSVSLFSLGIVEDDASDALVGASLRAVQGALAPYRVGDYPNFVERPADASAFFDAATWRRLREAKASYDPADVFRGSHHIPPADPRPPRGG